MDSYAAICAYHTLFALKWLPALLPPLPLVPMEPFQLTSFALVRPHETRRKRCECA